MQTSLPETNSAELGVSVREASDTLLGGKGKGGIVNIKVGDTLTIAGGNTPGIFASLGDAEGRGGDIKIQAGKIFVRDGGLIGASTLGRGDAANISITADKAISLFAVEHKKEDLSSQVQKGCQKAPQIILFHLIRLEKYVELGVEIALGKKAIRLLSHRGCTN